MDPASGPRRERQPPQPSLSPRGVDCCPSAARLGLLLGHPSRRSAATAAKASGPAAPSPGGRLGGKENLLLSGHDRLGPWSPPLESTTSRPGHLTGVIHSERRLLQQSGASGSSTLPPFFLRRGHGHGSR